MKYCSKCGNQVLDDAIICPKCGCMVDGKLKSEKNEMAVVGFICSFFSSLLGLIFGGIGLYRSEDRNGNGKGLSIAAILISCFIFFVKIIELVDLIST